MSNKWQNNKRKDLKKIKVGWNNLRIKWSRNCWLGCWGVFLLWELIIYWGLTCLCFLNMMILGNHPNSCCHQMKFQKWTGEYLILSKYNHRNWWVVIPHWSCHTNNKSLENWTTLCNWKRPNHWSHQRFQTSWTKGTQLNNPILSRSNRLETRNFNDQKTQQSTTVIKVWNNLAHQSNL